MNLTNLTVQQSTIVPNNLSDKEAEYLYQTYKKYNIDRSSVLRGLININHGYASHWEELHTRWTGLKYTIGENYIEWTDQEFQKCISMLHGDGVGITDLDTRKSIVLNTPAINSESNSMPFYGNKDVEIIDMRPFTNFESNRNIRDISSNLCVVKATDTQTEYKLKEIYISSVKNGGGFSPFSFIESGDSNTPMYTIQKGWYEGPNIQGAMGEIIMTKASNPNRCRFEHFYWLNHSLGLGQSNRKEFTMPGEDTPSYYITTQGDWSTSEHSGVCYDNIIIDSPIPILFSAGWPDTNSWWKKNTIMYVPDNQKEMYDYIYGQLVIDNRTRTYHPAGIQSISTYNSKFRDLANWWTYTGKTTYQTQY